MREIQGKTATAGKELVLSKRGLILGSTFETWPIRQEPN
jgi:hypothetical protein